MWSLRHRRTIGHRFRGRGIATLRQAEWATIENGKIVELRVFFDARPFAAMFER
jgi:hypothetical protein